MIFREGYSCDGAVAVSVSVSVAQLVECLSKYPKPCVHSQALCQPGKVAHTSNSNTWEVEKQESEMIRYSRPLSAIWNLWAVISLGYMRTTFFFFLNRALVNSMRCQNRA